MVKTSDLNSLRGPSQHCIGSAVKTLGVEVPCCFLWLTSASG